MLRDGKNFPVQTKGFCVSWGEHNTKIGGIMRYVMACLFLFSSLAYSQEVTEGGDVVKSEDEVVVGVDSDCGCNKGKTKKD